MNKLNQPKRKHETLSLKTSYVYQIIISFHFHKKTKNVKFIPTKK